MDQLLGSLKVSRSLSSVAFYIFIFVLILVIIGVSAASYLFLKGYSVSQLQTTFPTVPVNTVLYILAGVIVFVVLLTLIGTNFDFYFAPKAKTGINRSTPTSSVFWKPGSGSPPQDPINMRVESDEFPMSSSDTYSVGIEISVYDTRSSDTQGPYRHIVHRGTDELIRYKAGSPGSVPKGQGGLNDGLPEQMNPGVFLDRFTNDLIIFVDTDPTGSGESSYRESVRISDIPLRKPFYVHLSLHDQLLEVYINCRLAATKLLSGTPRAVPNEWYGRIGFARAAALLQNLRLWNSDLYAFELRTMCPVIVIPPNVAPTSCSV